MSHTILETTQPILILPDGDTLSTFLKIPTQLEHIMTTLTELTTTLNMIDIKLNKARDEILAQIRALGDALANVTLPTEADAALEALRASAQALDDIVPDVPSA